jgi:hypothetical protein
MPRARTIIRWLLTTALIALLILYVLSLPFYAGSSITPNTSWRFEHARLTVKHSPVSHTESFCVDFNSEGLKWAPKADFHGTGDWSITLPLWTPLALAAVPATFLWRSRLRAPPGHCKHCRYDRRSLPPTAPCPECGRTLP